MSNKSSDPFIIECFGTKSDKEPPLIDPKSIDIMVFYFLISSCVIMMTVWIIHMLRKSHCISQTTADNLIEECRTIRVPYPPLIQSSKQ